MGLPGRPNNFRPWRWVCRCWALDRATCEVFDRDGACNSGTSLLQDVGKKIRGALTFFFALDFATLTRQTHEPVRGWEITGRIRVPTPHYWIAGTDNFMRPY